MSKRSSLFTTPLALGASSLGLLLMLTSPAHAESATTELAAEVTEAPPEMPPTDGGADVADAGPEARAEAGVDGIPPDVAPTVDGPPPADAGSGVDMAVSADAAARNDAATAPTSDDGDCGCRVGGAGRGTSGTLTMFGVVAGVLLVRRRVRRTRTCNPQR